MRLDVPSFNRHGVVVALDSESCVGLAATSDNRQYGYVFNEMTGVVPGHRGRGIALAIKVTADGATRAGVSPDGHEARASSMKVVPASSGIG